MFGWEFPPFVAGGLGTACHGLVRALLKRGVNITLILPKNITSAREEGLTILGAEYWEFCLNREIKTEEIHNDIHLLRSNIHKRWDVVKNLFSMVEKLLCIEARAGAAERNPEPVKNGPQHWISL